MKSVLDALPDILMPDATGEADAPGQALQWPDEEDLIRPDAEDELGQVAEAGALTRSGQAPLGKHLVWTFGPVHRALAFPLQLRFELAGERIVTCDPEIGWTHQGLERMFTQVTFEEGIKLAARLCPENPIPSTLTYVLAVERLLGIADQVPRQTQQFRVLSAELSRIAAHLLVIASLLTGISDIRARGAIISATQTVATLLSLVAAPDGRLLVAHIGGLAGNIAPGALEAAEKALPDALGPVADAQRELFRDPSFTDSLRGRGAIDADRAIAAGLTGPALRATGEEDDLRRQGGAFAYKKLTPRVVTQTAGDALARLAVRWDEVQASGALCLRTIASLMAPAKVEEKSVEEKSVEEKSVEAKEANADVKGVASSDEAAKPEPPRERPDESPRELPRNDAGDLTPPAGRASGGTEAPSGEMWVLIDHKGGTMPHRVRWKTASFSLASALPKFLEGQTLDDVVPILRSLGIHPCELDR